MTLAQTSQALKTLEENQNRLDSIEAGLVALIKQQQETLKMVEAFDAQYPSLPSNDIFGRHVRLFLQHSIRVRGRNAHSFVRTS